MFQLIPYYIILDILYNWMIMEYNCYDEVFNKKFSGLEFFGYFKFDFTRKIFFLFKNWNINAVFISRNKVPVLKMFNFFPFNYVCINNYEYQHNLRIVESKEEIIQNNWENGIDLGIMNTPVNRYYYYNCNFCMPRIYKFLGSSWKSVYIKTQPSFIEEFLKNRKNLKILEINLNVRTFDILDHLSSNLEVLVLLFDNKGLFQFFETSIILQLSEKSKRIIDQQKELKSFTIKVTKIFSLSLKVPKRLKFKIEESLELLKNKSLFIH